MVRAWQSGEGLPRRVRRRVLLLLWLSMGLSIFIVGKLWAAITLVTIGLCVSLYLLKKPVSD